MDQETLLHIHTTPRTGRPMVSHQTAVALTDRGIDGDRYAAGTGKYSQIPAPRDITLFPIETLRLLQAEHGIDMHVQDHRRNLTTQGIDPNTLIGRRFSVGDVTLLGLRPCQPYRYLNMMCKKQISTRLIDRAGVFCRVVDGGTFRVGDPIALT